MRAGSPPSAARATPPTNGPAVIITAAAIAMLRRTAPPPRFASSDANGTAGSGEGPLPRSSGRRRLRRPRADAAVERRLGDERGARHRLRHAVTVVRGRDLERTPQRRSGEGTDPGHRVAVGLADEEVASRGRDPVLERSRAGLGQARPAASERAVGARTLELTGPEDAVLPAGEKPLAIDGAVFDAPSAVGFGLGGEHHPARDPARPSSDRSGARGERDEWQRHQSPAGNEALHGQISPCRTTPVCRAGPFLATRAETKHGLKANVADDTPRLP